MKKHIQILISISTMIGLSVFIACGDDGSSALEQEKKDTVSSLYELGKCSSVNLNDSFFVDNKNAYYKCTYVCSGYLSRVENNAYTNLNDDNCYDWINEKSDDNGESEYVNESSSSSTIDQTIYYSSVAESDYKNEEEAFLYKEFFIDIELTLFNQISDNWENQTKHKGDYSDGDPWISFIIKTYADDDLKDSLQTDVFKPGDDIGKWTGSKHFKQNFSGGANNIHICPVVYEHNSVQKDVLKSSNYCYFINDVGNKVNIPIMQNDSESTDCELEWTITISYK